MAVFVYILLRPNRSHGLRDCRNHSDGRRIHSYGAVSVATAAIFKAMPQRSVHGQIDVMFRQQLVNLVKPIAEGPLLTSQATRRLVMCHQALPIK